MEFTYDALRRLYGSIQTRGYRICTYSDYPREGRCAILRHDIDTDPAKALDLARRENAWGGALDVLCARHLFSV